jgi:hypothetical protein
MNEDDLILCSPTVPDISYGNELWGRQKRSHAHNLRYKLTCSMAELYGHQLESRGFRSTCDPRQAKGSYAGTN